jgi:DNA-binding transcriptional LysR family regulator
VDFDWLTTFLEVARQKSFSRAGEKLHLTQPSISAQIRALESHVGHRLLNRGGGKVTLTAAGRVFQPFAEQSLSQLRHIHLTLADMERMPRGTLTVSANDSTALYVLPLLISKFKKQYPRVALNIVRAERAKTLELVLEREVEFGIASLPVKDARLHVDTIHKDNLVLVVPAGHPLTRDGDAAAGGEVWLPGAEPGQAPGDAGLPVRAAQAHAAHHHGTGFERVTEAAYPCGDGCGLSAAD